MTKTADSLLRVLPGLRDIAQAIDRGANVADHLGALARMVTKAEREHGIDGPELYCRAIQWLRTREVAR